MVDGLDDATEERAEGDIREHQSTCQRAGH